MLKIRRSVQGKFKIFVKDFVPMKTGVMGKNVRNKNFQDFQMAGNVPSWQSLGCKILKWQLSRNLRAARQKALASLL